MLHDGYPLLSLALISVNAPDWSTANYNEFFTSSTNSRVLVHNRCQSFITTCLSSARRYPDRLRLVTSQKISIPAVTPRYCSLSHKFPCPYLCLIALLHRQRTINSTSSFSLTGSSAPGLDLQWFCGPGVGMIHVMLPFAILSIYSVMRVIHAAAACIEELPCGAISASHDSIFPATAFLFGEMSGGLLVFLLCLGSYITPVLLGGLRDVMLAAFIQVQVMQLVNWGFAAASAFVLLVVTLVGYFCLSSATGVTIGGKLRSASADGTSKRRLLALTGSSFRRGNRRR